MVEGWIIYRTPRYPFTVRKFYGFGRTRVFVRGATAADTLDEARSYIPAGRGLVRVKSKEVDVEEVWVSPVAITTILRQRAKR